MVIRVIRVRACFERSILIERSIREKVLQRLDSLKEV